MSGQPDKIYVGQPVHMLLEGACALLGDALGPCFFVGQCLDERGYRHIDVRMILPDNRFRILFGTFNYPQARSSSLWVVLSSSISLFLTRSCGKEVDFQIQNESWSKLHFADQRRVPVGTLSTRKEMDR